MDLNYFLRCAHASFEKLTGKKFPLPLTANFREALDHAPFVFLSHGTEADPILNYGNHLCLKLWGMDFAAFTQMPSRLTAEAPIQSERAALLKVVSQQGYIDNYSGVRVSSTGKKFTILKATVWNVFAEEMPIGQAAMFNQWA